MTGSSPRMWGTLALCPGELLENRFIPTHVGNTYPGEIPKLLAAVHPHACGEHANRSSDPIRNPRFIPTHVGNTLAMDHPLKFPAVHPHACGEHDVALGRHIFSLGSSPRMWGTLNRRLAEQRLTRFIPTHVGNTRSDRVERRTYPVHPHACGEHKVDCKVAGWETGSSPRMWGTLCLSYRTTLCGRFIPTHVGNTGCNVVVSYRKPVHPHACGEHNTSTSD